MGDGEIKSLNQYRGDLNGWIRSRDMSPHDAMNFIRTGGQFGGARVPSLEQFTGMTKSQQFNQWDNKYNLENSWITPNGTRVAPHNPVDKESGNPLNWSE